MSNEIAYNSNEFVVVGDNTPSLTGDGIPDWLTKLIKDTVNNYVTNNFNDNSSSYYNYVDEYTNYVGDTITTINNNISTIDGDLGALYDLLSGYNGNIIKALENLDIAKNDYKKYLIKQLSDYESYVGVLQTLNSTIAGNDASIRNLLQTYATKDFAAATSAQLLTASLNGGAIGAKIATAQSAMATQYGAMAQRLDSLSATYTDSINSLQAKAQVAEALGAYVGKIGDGSTSSLSYKISRLDSYLTDSTTGELYGGVSQNLGGYTETTAKRLANGSVDTAVKDLYSKYSKITVGGKDYINGFGLFANYNGTTGGSSTFWVAADEFKIYDSKNIKANNITTQKVYDKDGTAIEVVTNVSGVAPFKIENGITYIQNAVIGYDKVTNTPTHTSGSLSNRPVKPVEGSTYTDTGVTPNVVYIYGPSGWSTANQGQFKSIVFKRSSTAPNPPTGGSYASPVPSGWSDGIPAENGSPCYFSVRTFTVNGGAPQDASWATPALLANTADTKYVYSNSATQPSISGTGPNTPFGWIATASVDAVWAAVSTMSNGTWTSWSVYKIKGENGKDGVSISSVTEYYLASSLSSGVTATTSGWTTTVPTLTATNKYMWNKTVTTYSGGKADDTTVVLIGTIGESGRGISSITEEYQVSSSNTTAPSTWQSTPPALTSTNKYMWNKTTINYTDGLNPTVTKVVIGSYGDKGDTGARGSFTKSIDLKFNSSTNIQWRWTGDSTWSTNKYLNRDAIVGISHPGTPYRVLDLSPIDGDNFIVTEYDANNKVTANKQYVRTGGAWLFNVALMVHGDAIIDGTLSASKIETKSITTDKLAAGAVGSINLAGTLQSDDFVSGSKGWQINKNGTAKFESLVLHTKNLDVNSVSTIYHATGPEGFASTATLTFNMVHDGSFLVIGTCAQGRSGHGIYLVVDGVTRYSESPINFSLCTLQYGVENASAGTHTVSISGGHDRIASKITVFLRYR